MSASIVAASLPRTMDAFDLHCSRGIRRICLGARKLEQRGQLPGAFGWDQSARAFRLAVQDGVAPALFLPAAMPGSWMVNSTATSVIYQQWLRAPLRGVWSDLVEALQLDSAQWLALSDAERDRIGTMVRTLSIDGHAIASISKVLGLLCPNAVCLMDDAAIWLALGKVPMATRADRPVAGGELFVPMMNWFHTSVLASSDALRALAAQHSLVSYSDAQVLDRLLWFESWGYRILARATDPVRWRWVRDGDIEAVVMAPAGPPEELLDLATLEPELQISIREQWTLGEGQPESP